MRLSTCRTIIATGLVLACIGAASASAILTVRPMFPRDNVWNVAIDTLPVDANSAAYVTTIGPAKPMHADFGTVYNGAPNGIPFVVVTGAQPRVAVSFDYADESDPGPYPIPPDAPIEGGPQAGGDRHVLVVDRDGGKLYELFAAYPNADGGWHAGSGAIFDLNSNALRPASWTSADAAGLPILPGLVRYEEVVAGEIPHALRFTAPQTRNTFVWPARHQASSLAGANYPPLGQRFRLKASVDLSGFGPNVQVILRALKKYGMFLADNGSSWFLSGAPDPRWDDDELHQLGRLTGNDFEAVDESSLMVDPNSGGTTPAALPRAATEVQVVEYHRGTGGDYFLTADGGEIAALDAGRIPGWVRTGQVFHAYAAESVLQADMSPVCRFYRRPEAGQHSHFFSAYIDECVAVASWLSSEWLLESANVFVVSLPVARDGSCAPGNVPVYRLYNNDPVSVDHRYTTSAAIQSQMMAAGWVAEGFGPDAVAMCAPAQ
jgi:hypothetical protein